MGVSLISENDVAKFRLQAQRLGVVFLNFPGHETKSYLSSDPWVSD